MLKLRGKVKNDKFDYLDNQIKLDVFGRILNEELSVRTDSEKETRLIKNRIVKKLRETDPDRDENDIYFFSNNISVKLFGRDIKIFFSGYVFADEYQFEKFYNKYDFSCSSSVKRSGEITMEIIFPIISGDVPDNFLGNSIAHELEHIYWTINHYDKSDRFYDYYSKCCSIIESNDYTKKEKDIAKAFYFSVRFERVAFSQGLNQILNSGYKDGVSTMDDLYDAFYNSDEYRHLKFVKSILDRVDEYSEEVFAIFGWNIEKFTKYLQKSYNEFVKSLYRVIYRKIMDINGKLYTKIF